MHEWLSETRVAVVRDAPGLAELSAEERRLRQAVRADVAAARTRDPQAAGPPRANPLALPRNNLARAAHLRSKRGTGN